jgi:hypothetical protein
MNYERGLDAFKQLAQGTEWYQDFAVYEAPLRENLRDERLYGPSEQTRRDRTRIVDQLNALALEHLGISFNDLCLSKQPSLQLPTKVNRNWDTDVIRQLLTEAFDDQELTTLCFDHFRTVYENLSSGMSKGQKIQYLLDYCVRQGQIEVLLELVKERNPTKYDHFALRLRIKKSEPPPELPPPLPQPLRQQSWVRFKLQIARLVNMEFEARAIETPMGEPLASGRLPYSLDELGAVLRALGMPEYDPDRFTPAQRGALQRLGLVINAYFVDDLHKRVGQTLFDSLMVGDVNTAFQMALNRARERGGVVDLQLRFDEDVVQLAQYPWELLYHRRALLPSRAVELTRYISYPEAVTALNVAPPLRLLYIQSRPSGLSALATNEQMTSRKALSQLEAEQLLKLDVLARPTYEALLDYLETNAVHVLHFDGHGAFARQCPKCRSMNYPHQTQCQAQKSGTICGQEIGGVEPRGYLAFENTAGQVEWISSEVLGNLLYNRPLRLAVLSACRSGGVGGDTLFGGVAPALIQAGIPAVVSTQLPISVDAASRFMQGFYHALARFESVPAAMNAGRIRVIQTNEWFIPTLYLRSKDDEGCLFTQKSGG